MRCSRSALSPRNSLKSTKAPLRAFSTTFAGIGDSAGDRIKGDNLSGVTASAEIGGNDASQGDRDCRLGGTAGPLATDAVVAPNGAKLDGDKAGAAAENRGIDAIDAAAGSVVAIDNAASPTREWADR